MIATLFVTFILLLACSFPIAVSQSFASMFLIFGDAPLSRELHQGHHVRLQLLHPGCYPAVHLRR